MCSALGNIPGVPKVHFKGKQGDYYVMVSSSCRILPPCRWVQLAHAQYSAARDLLTMPLKA